VTAPTPGRASLGHHHGVVAIVLGAVTLASWPVSAVWLIGVLIGIDFLLAGATLIAAGHGA